MKILVCNSGSSSLKFNLSEADQELLLAEGRVDWTTRPTRLVFRRPSHPEIREELHLREHSEALGRILADLRGYTEKGNINTPLDLAIRNQIDRFTIAMDVFDRVPTLRASGGHAKEKLRILQLECQAYAYENGIDKPEMDGWTWPGNG